MRKLSLSFLPVCLLLLIHQSISQELKPRDQAVADAASQIIRADAIRAHMRFLSDGLPEGREPGTRGYDIAAKYVAALLESFSLQPAGERGTWFQTVPIRKSINVAEKSSFELSREAKKLELKSPADFLILGDLTRTESDVEARVVFVGYGVTAPELNYDDYANVDVRGKIVMYLTNAPPRFSASMRGFYADDQGKIKNAAAHGAVGILVFLLPEDEKGGPVGHTFYRSPYGKFSLD